MFAWWAYFGIRELYSAMAGLSVWTQRHLSQFQLNFDNADKDKSGSLDFEEVHNVLLESGFKGSQDESKRLFQELDTDKSCTISKAEFTKAMAGVPKITMREIVLRRAFKKIDADGSGSITREEIMENCLGEEAAIDIPAEKISDMLIYLVKDNDKKIDYEEFLQLFVKKATSNTMRSVFKQLDKDNSGTLTKQEIMAGIKSEPELNLKAPGIAELLIKWCKGNEKGLNYEEFLQAYEKH